MADFTEVDITEDPEYADLVPIPQDDGPNPVVAIRYNKKFRDVHNYFRAIIHKNEISERALKLSENVIQLNAANYTAWQFRRECIFKLKYDLMKELQFSKVIAIKSPKNYQLWWHRRIIIEAINKDQSIYDLNLEKELLRDILKSDNKNYHAWSHYHWILRSYKLYDDELQYLEKKLLLHDIRNNSAWNHRHFVVKQTTGFNNIDVLQREIEFCRKKIEKLAANDSIWYYYTQIVTKYLKEYSHGDLWQKQRLEQIKWIQSVLDKKPYATRAILFYVDLLSDKQNTNKEDLIQARTLLQLLGNKVDRIRYNYYNYLIKGIEKQMTFVSDK